MLFLKQKKKASLRHLRVELSLRAAERSHSPAPTPEGPGRGAFRRVQGWSDFSYLTRLRKMAAQTGPRWPVFSQTVTTARVTLSDGACRATRCYPHATSHPLLTTTRGGRRCDRTPLYRHENLERRSDRLSAAPRMVGPGVGSSPSSSGLTPAGLCVAGCGEGGRERS